MIDDVVRRAYSERAAEYTALLGSVGDLHELDRQRIGQWADGIDGHVLDAGCGPGQWTDFLHRRGVDVSGIDLVPAFVDQARVRFPGIRFNVASLGNLDVPDHSLGAVLAWYSLIHLRPAELPHVLAGFTRAFAPGGQLLVGFFEGPHGQTLDHAITPAHYCSIDRFSRLLDDAGFEVLDVETRQDEGSRPHASMSAVRR
ncbi:class I SAM-dependent methyltransferase [Arthrobacter sp.]|uniref:class I SAM-dependent methyltransferase n=1 Tax=Arthrobacter sp. TaxID=1667 RepID=UPI003A900D09